MPQVALNVAIVKFINKYWVDDQIVSVGEGNGSIRVVVKSLAAASKLPATFRGYAVNVYQGQSPDKLNGPGDKVVVRDKDGKVTGVQG